MTRFVAVAFALSLPMLALDAQAPASAGFTGRVTADTVPLRNARVRATLGSRTLEALTNDNGEFRVTDMTVGTWRISVRRVGYTPVVDTVILGTIGAHRDYRLTPIAAVLDPVLVESRWIGVRGIVVDARTQRPLAGAALQFSGTRGLRMESDSVGTFSLERIPGSEVVLRVRRDGYATKVVSLKVPKDAYAQVEVALDTLLQPASLIVEGDLDSRLRWAAPRSGLVPGEEILNSTAKNLKDALLESETVRRKGLAMVLMRGPTCYLLNGFPLYNPVHSIPPELVEFVEVYPTGTEYSGTLALRFSRQGGCGARTLRALRSAPNYVSIWTRDRR